MLAFFVRQCYNKQVHLLIFRDIPLKYAILQRNRYMIEKADLVFAYVNKAYGGAYQAFTFAQRLGKKIINLADM